jgi:hypothetical protein
MGRKLPFRPTWSIQRARSPSPPALLSVAYRRAPPDSSGAVIPLALVSLSRGPNWSVPSPPCFESTVKLRAPRMKFRLNQLEIGWNQGINSTSDTSAPGKPKPLP